MIAVIGGSGFIGTRLCEIFFQSGINFTIIDKVISQRFPQKTVIADISNPISLSENFKFELIINLAAEHRDDVEPKILYEKVNVGGARNIVDYAVRSSIKKIIFTSSVAVYGFADIGTDEKGAIAPFNEYGRTKWEAEKIFSDWQKLDQLNNSLVIIRPTVVFGEGNRGNVYSLLKQIARKKFLMIGKGSNHKSLAYVQNLADFIRFSTRFEPGNHIYNYVDKPDFSMRKLVNFISSELGVNALGRFYIPYRLGLMFGLIFDVIGRLQNKKYPISLIRIKKFCANSTYSTAVEKTGFCPSITIEEALKKTISYEFNS